MTFITPGRHGSHPATAEVFGRVQKRSKCLKKCNEKNCQPKDIRHFQSFVADWKGFTVGLKQLKLKFRRQEEDWLIVCFLDPTLGDAWDSNFF